MALITKVVCSHCKAGWTLKEGVGVCPICGQPSQAHRQTIRAIEARPYRRKRAKNTDRQSIEDSYDQLDGEWREWLEVARRYEHKVPYQDRLDVRHDIIIELAKARTRDNKPLPILRAYRIASLMIALYWRQARRQPTTSLDTEVEDFEGNSVSLIETVSDDHAIEAVDIDAKVDASRWLLGCPMRLIEIAIKRKDGIPLERKEQTYLNHYQARQLKKYQKALI